MSFILKTAYRDARPSFRRLALTALAIVLGVAALTAVGSFRANLDRAIADQARGLLGADLEVTSRGGLSDEASAFLRSLGGEQAREVSFASMAVFPGRDGAADRSRLVTVRAVEGAYPFYGDFVTEPPGARAALGRGDTAVLEETLLKQFGLEVGDPVRLGRKTFTVAGALRRVPGESAAVALLSPRVFVSYEAPEGAGLLGPGSIVRHKAYFKFGYDVDVEALARGLRGRFRELRLGFDTVEERKEELGRALENVSAFLGLTGFVALFLGAIGVASAMQVYIRQKRATVAVLRCLGAPARTGFAVFLVQATALGLAGSAAGAALGLALQGALPPLMRDFLPLDVVFFIAWAEVARAFTIGLVLTVLFTLLPLLAVRRVSPLTALRAAALEEGGARDPLRVVLWIAIAGAVAGFAVWQTGSWRAGLGFAGGLAAGIAVLGALAKAVTWTARRLTPRALPYVWRQGVANLHRPNNRTVLLVLALGLGTFLLLTLALTRATLMAQIRGTGADGRPTLLFFDVQDDQIGRLREVLAGEGAPAMAEAPIVTMRLQSVQGRPVAEMLRDADSTIPAWTLRREYRSTYRGGLTETEKVVAGEFVGSVDLDTEVAPISVEQKLAVDLRIGLGDELVFDVQGVPVRARVASLREVEWRRMSPNFFVVFPEGVLEAAPKFYVVAARSEGVEASARVQQAVVRALPNVSVIDLALVIDTLDRIFAKAQLVVQFMALFTLATGVVVLAGAILAGRHQRIREIVLLRTLGASQRQLMQIQLVEYAVLGVLAALVGAGLATGANVAVATWVFKTTPVAPWGELVAAVAGAATLTVATGLLANRGLVRQPPLEVLRAEG